MWELIRREIKMSRIYFNKKKYIDKLGECLAVKDDFGDMSYFRNSKGEEFIIVSDIIGQVGMLNITGYGEADILHCVAQVECGIAPKNYITDKAKRLEIAKAIR